MKKIKLKKKINKLKAKVRFLSFHIKNLEEYIKIERLINDKLYTDYELDLSNLKEAIEHNKKSKENLQDIL